MYAIITYMKHERDRQTETQRQTDRQTDRDSERQTDRRVRMIYSFRPLPVTKA